MSDEKVQKAHLTVSFHGMEDYKLRYAALIVAANHAYRSEVEETGMADLIDISRDEWVEARIEEWLTEAEESEG